MSFSAGSGTLRVPEMSLASHPSLGRNAAAGAVLILLNKARWSLASFGSTIDSGEPVMITAGVQAVVCLTVAAHGAPCVQAENLHLIHRHVSHLGGNQLVIDHRHGAQLALLQKLYVRIGPL